MVRAMSFVEHKTGTCMYLESRALSEDHIDPAQFDNTLLQEGGQYLCGHTTRVNGPDYRPADPKTCVRGRSCFKSHEMF